MKLRLTTLLTICLIAQLAMANRVRLFGYVLDEENKGIELANVYVEGTTTGTTTNKNGYYDLQVDFTDTLTIAWSMLGYQTIHQPMKPEQDVLQVNVVLPADAELLEEVEVKGIKHQQGTMDYIDASVTRTMPDATGGSIESVLITFAGVSQNNEMSSQYNVRGGSFDENEVYVNGIEVHRPLLLRAGQQEGLSFVNPQMVENVQFSAGGFDAKYGDKMSSVLDITYRKANKFEASIGVSLLGANLFIGAGDSTYSTLHGIRYKTSSYLLGTLETKGTYKPNYVDYQTYSTWKLGRNRSERAHSRWEMSALGNVSYNSYRFVPEEMTESFGTYTTARSLSIYYEGQEKDRFLTVFGAIGASYQANKDINIGFDLSGFYTNEQENFDISGEYVLSESSLDGTDASISHGETIDSETTSEVLGTGTYHEHARNRLQAGVVTLAHNGSWKSGNNKLLWGTSLQGEFIKDEISEWEWQDSMGYSMPLNESAMELYYAMKGESQMQTIRWQAYGQDTYKWNTEKGDVVLTGGVRMNWWSFNNEFLCSPRASVSYIPGWKHDFAFRLATGLYYQAPFYKELRDTVTDAAGITRIQLNKDIKAQRSVHIVLGSDYYFRAWGRPFKFTAEAYYKYMDRVISYTVDNVRVRYSGKNDAEAYTTGVDLKLYGELVPGAESWISFSWMHARERLDGSSRGWIPGPNEQRYNFSMLFQDYIPRFPQYKFFLKMIFADGLPYGSPRNTETRAAFRTKSYKRIDIGASRTFSDKTDKWMRKSGCVKSWSVQFEVFNLVGFKNVNSYFWVSDVYGQQWASPNYLTGRMFNLKFTVDFR